MRVHLCGVRGSMPAAGEEFAGVGGNTSCVAVAHDDGPPVLIIDAGSGMRRVTDLMAGEAFRGTIVLGHLHLDHVLGLPFFRAGDRPDAEVRLLLPEQGVAPAELMARALGPPFFPITTEGLRGHWTLETFDEGTFDAGGFTVTALEVPHKGGRTMGLRVSDGTSSFAYLSDHAPQDLGPGERGVGVLHEAAVRLADRVDLLIHGAMYTREELPARIAFGHAAADYAVELGERCRVGRVVLFHHEPWRTDDAVVAVRDGVAATTSLPVQHAVEGRVLVI